VAVPDIDFDNAKRVAEEIKKIGPEGGER